MKYSLLFFTALLATSSVNAVDLGPANVYVSVGGDPRLEVTMVQIGKREDKIVLGHIHEKGGYNGYKIYRLNCETTRCNKIYYYIVGSKKLNIISNSGYYGKHYKIALKGYNRPVPVVYSEEKSDKKNAKRVYAQYLKSVGRSPEGSASKIVTKKTVRTGKEELQSACRSKVSVSMDWSKFEKKGYAHLLGMSGLYLKGIAKICADADYRAVLSKITKVIFEPGTSAQKDKFVQKGEQLRIYLSPNSYNPTDEVNTWVETL